MTIFLKHMVSTRCKKLVREELEGLGLHHKKVELGEVEIEEEITTEQLGELNTILKRSGIEILDNRVDILVEQIKVSIVELIHLSESTPELKLSSYLSRKLHYNYSYLAQVFSASKGVTIERYHILHKIERVKELLAYGELNTTEIAWAVGYSSVAHLCNQFKRFTGMTTRMYKRNGIKGRKVLEDV